MYTGGFSPRGAGGAASRDRGNTGSGSLYIERIGLLGLPGRRGLVSSGDRATRGPPRGWEVSLNFRRIRRMLGREHRATVDGRARADRARAGCRPIIHYRALINFVDAILGRSAAR